VHCADLFQRRVGGVDCGTAPYLYNLSNCSHPKWVVIMHFCSVSLAAECSRQSCVDADVWCCHSCEAAMLLQIAWCFTVCVIPSGSC
jgi:hypothetical protein